jgi:hypothetical protein
LPLDDEFQGNGTAPPGCSRRAERPNVTFITRRSISMTAAEWIKVFCEEIGTPPPSADETAAILRLAAVAAHASERTAAPVACWVAGRDGRALEDLEEIAERVAPSG